MSEIKRRHRPIQCDADVCETLAQNIELKAALELLIPYIDDYVRITSKNIPVTAEMIKELINV